MPASGNSCLCSGHNKASPRPIREMSVPPATLVIIGASANNAQRQRQKQETKSSRMNVQQMPQTPLQINVKSNGWQIS
ncbi:hypothetical protein AWZ03_009626 [Drosophila navojoa]|uniref:Uncharacterized protein n=1 Tax=Drosophila navojoa TaxID=7232 RepID=A0A484B5K4_DRONA|nr:hypothetical protein AWZ03_009626 [Drosophila navojoa]